jgi:hypothetical protein
MLLITANAHQILERVLEKERSAGEELFVRLTMGIG